MMDITPVDNETTSYDGKAFSKDYDSLESSKDLSNGMRSEDLDSLTKNTFESPSLESDSIEALSLKLLKVSDELYKANTDLEAKNAALAKSEAARKEMLANISHDLRAPITAIRSSLDLINSYDEIPKEELKNTLGLIDRRVATLESLIQDMYYLFCVEDEARPLSLETIEAGAFLESYFYDAIVDSRYDDHEMDIDIPMDLKCTVSIDVQKTIRVLDNLFTNAAKYSGSGSTITLSACKEDDRLIIKVSDNGIGISEADLEKLFERTYTVSSSRTPGTEAGSGLGLAIVKATIEREKGTVYCESKLGEGSSFFIELPVID